MALLYCSTVSIALVIKKYLDSGFSYSAIRGVWDKRFNSFEIRRRLNDNEIVEEAFIMFGNEGNILCNEEVEYEVSEII